MDGTYHLYLFMITTGKIYISPMLFFFSIDVYFYDFITCNLALPILNFILHITDKFIDCNEFSKILNLEKLLDSSMPIAIFELR